jgi:hypothetical protein
LRRAAGVGAIAAPVVTPNSAWRLVDLLSATGPWEIAGFGKSFKADVPGVTMVRNHLLEHPDKHSANFSNTISHSSNDVVLKCQSFEFEPATGKMTPAPDHPDRGLRSNAQELHHALHARLKSASS